MHKTLIILFTALSYASAQQVGTNTAENHPSLNVQTCTTGGCTTQTKSIVLDANWRWLHTTTGSTNCYTGQTWNAALCPDGDTCAKNCALDGADYGGTYSISTSNDAATLGFVTQTNNGPNVGSRIYLLQDDNNYQMFNLLNGEFSFDVDVSQLPCGLNGALYFTQMDQDGGMQRFPTNKAGPRYGTGYCDAQCPRDLKFINGIANVAGWTPSPNDINSGKGNNGTCCAEMDIWEANSMATAYTAHPCSVDQQTSCTGDSCTNTCDSAGCDFNSWRMGNETFYGPGMTIDTKSKITVVTQFVTDDNTNQGNLIQINRFYVQDGEQIPNSFSSFSGIDSTNSITDSFCTQQKTVFGDDDIFRDMGGLQEMGAAFKAGMVLTMSVWDDHNVNCLWLDSDYPTTADPNTPGVSRGPCSTSSGAPTDLEKNSPGAKVTFSNIKWGELNSTFTNNIDSSSSPPSNSSQPASSSSSSGGDSTTTQASIATTNQTSASSTAQVSSDITVVASVGTTVVASGDTTISVSAATTVSTSAAATTVETSAAAATSSPSGSEPTSSAGACAVVFFTA